MDDIFLPVLSHFENGNPWTASLHRLRYRIVPGDAGLTAEVWEGPWAYEFSAVESTRVFPLDEQGLIDLRAWIGTWAGTVNARPQHSLSENIQRRTAPSAPA